MRVAPILSTMLLILTTTALAGAPPCGTLPGPEPTGSEPAGQKHRPQGTIRHQGLTGGESAQEVGHDAAVSAFTRSTALAPS